MECRVCGGAVSERIADREHPYRYEASGLENLFLVGIVVKSCPKCGEIPVIPRVEELYQVIVRGIVEKPAPLNGQELRFIRKIARFSAKEFAGLLGLDPSSLSNFENGRRANIAPSADKLARALVVAACDDARCRELLLRERARRPPDHRKRRPRTEFRLVKNRWKAAA